MNKKIKECENIEFLPQKFQEELKEQSDKNILATLCYCRFRFSDYASANNGFFFTSLEELAKESLVDESTVKRRLALLQMKKYIERKSGTNHQCTHYKLSKEIEELLGIEEEENSANEPLDKIRQDKTSLDKLSSDKLSLDETSQVESRQDNLRIEKEKMSLNSNAMTNSNKIENQFEIDKEILLNKIEEATDGLDFNAIESVKIPLNEFITSTFSNEIDRLKRILYNTLEKKKENLKETLLEEAMSLSSTEDNYPF